jgi:type IV pilus assembly protein PilA
MLQKMKKRLKNQRGMTLVELLAVIVILGIISAIAVPSIGQVINKTKTDAHVANAQQMVNAAKLAVASDKTAQPSNGDTLNLSLVYLQTEGYLDDFTDPDGDSYAAGTVTTPSEDAPAGSTSYVSVTNTDGKYTYEVALYGSKRHIEESPLSGIDRESVVDN